MGLWSFLRAWWRRRVQGPPARPPRAQPSGPALQPEAPAPEPAPEPAPPPIPEPVPELAPEPLSEAPPAPAAPPAAPDEDDAEEEEGWADEEEDDGAPDPFIAGAVVLPDPIPSDLDQRRAAARAEALSGEHRIYLHMAAGPGSLAEALSSLLEEGLVEAEVVEGDGGEPHILYRPVVRH